MRECLLFREKTEADNSETKTMMEDPIMHMVYRASEEFIKRCGGVEGSIKHFQALDRARVRKRKARRSPASGRAPAKNSRSAKRKTAALRP